MWWSRRRASCPPRFFGFNYDPGARKEARGATQRQKLKSFQLLLADPLDGPAGRHKAMPPARSKCERSGRRVGSSRSSGTIANSVATTRELSLRSEQLRVLLVHRTNIPAQFLSSVTALAFAHGTPASATAVSVCPQAAPYGWRPAPLPAPPPASCGQARAQRACSMAPCCLCRDSRTAPRW